jgi:hypothetical protein
MGMTGQFNTFASFAPLPIEQGAAWAQTSATWSCKNGDFSPKIFVSQMMFIVLRIEMLRAREEQMLQQFHKW